MNKELIIILGPTAIGKTDISIEIAKILETEIISFDSRQFYKELHIGTAPPDKKQLDEIPHHFIHNISIKDQYNAGIYEQNVIPKIESLFEELDKLIAVGGSGLYLDAICKGFDNIPPIKEDIRKKISDNYTQKGISWLQKELERKDPSYFKKIDKKNPQRIIRALEVFEGTGIPYSTFRLSIRKKRSFRIKKIGLNMDRKKLYNKINRRVDKMLDDGLLDEVIGLKKWSNLNPLQTVGYKELFDYLNNKCSLEDSIETIKKNTRRFAKRQLTWFRKDSSINWINIEEKEKIMSFI